MFPNSGFPAASTSSPFGASSFGKPATSGFNTSVFGQQPTTGFGTPATQPSLFGGSLTTPAFGQNTSTQSPFGGSAFPSTSTGTSNLFGAQPNASTSGGLFGSNTSSAFGAPKPAFGGFGTQPTTTSLFGQQQQTQQQSTSLFGQTSASGLFGSSFAPASAGGTTIKFTPLSGTDSVVKNGASTTINTRHHCITCMKEYEGKSLEELRCEDYTANRKGPQPGQQGAQATPGLFGTNPAQPSLFGASAPSTSTNLFGGSGDKSPFTSTQPFGAGTTSVFGSTASTVFGKPAAAAAPFGASPATTTSSFGFNSSTTPNFFGSNAASKPFGTTTQTGALFSGTTQPAPSFGSTASPFGNSFTSQPQQQGGIFGQPNPAFGNTTTSGFGAGAFGATSTTTPAFGTSTFGAPNQNTFGSTFKNPTTFNFGQTSTSNTLGTMFNNTATKTGSPFGQPSTGGLFSGIGTTNTFNTGSNVFSGLGTNTLGSSLGTMSNAQLGGNAAPNPLNQHLETYASIPFGISPLFKNLLLPSKSDEVTQPTSPAAQKAIITGQHFRISPKGPVRPKLKPLEPNNLTKKALFDGLDGGDSDFLADLTARPSLKKLDIRPEITVNSFNFSAAPVADTSHSFFPKSMMSLQRTTTKPIAESTPAAPNSKAKGLISTREFRIEHSPTARTPVKSGTDKSSPVKMTSGSDKDDSSDQDESPSSLREASKEHPAGITLTRDGYYTIPALSELAEMVDPKGSCVVPNFTIGRLNYGNIYYPDSMDVSGLNLDEIVHFRAKEVTVYPDEDTKPPVGQGLNRRAQVTLDQVWPKDKTTRLPITDVSRIAELNFESVLIRASAKHGTKFVEYRPRTGSWVFMVDHFSKYGLTDSDEEELPAADKKKMKLLPPDPSRPLNHPLQKSLIPTSTPYPNKQQLAPPDIASNVLISEEDEDMDYGINNPYDLDEDFERRNLSPTSKLGREMGISSHKVQSMKASFFESPVEFQPQQMMESEFLDYPLTFPLNELAQDSTWYRKSDFDGFTMPGEEVLDTHLIPTQMELDSIEHNIPEISYGDSLQPKVYILNHHRETVPLSESTRGALDKQEEKVLVDLCLFNNRSFKVGWGRGGTLCRISSCGTDKMEPSIFTTVPGTSQAIGIESLFSSDLDSTFEKSVEELLLAVYEQTEITAGPDAPTLKIKSGDEGLIKYSQVAQGLAGTHRDPFLVKFSSVWGLISALFEHIKDFAPDSHCVQMERKARLSNWLKSAVRDSVDQEVYKRSTDPSTVFSYLTGHCILKASEEAQKQDDFNMSLLVAECGCSNDVRGLAKQTLNQWKETEADRIIDVNRIKSMMVIAGVPIFESSSGTVNICSQLDWLRAFGIHLWYATPWNGTITDALRLYDCAFENDQYATSPRPDYSEHTVEGSTFDVKYHLLKLFSKKSHPLEPILNPNSFVADPLDYRLSWTLMRALNELGYSHVSHFASSLIHTSFASQLEAHGLWHWAVFVLLHLNPREDALFTLEVEERLNREWELCSLMSPYNFTRIQEDFVGDEDTNQAKEAPTRKSETYPMCEFEKQIKDLLERQITLDENCEKERFLREKLFIPDHWIYEAKATRATFHGAYESAARYFIKAENWNDSHNIIITHLSSKYIVNEKYDLLMDLLNQVAVGTGNSPDILGWSTGGSLILDYFRLVGKLNEKIEARDPSFGPILSRELEELCSKLNSLKTPTPLDRHCQSVMMETILDLVRKMTVVQDRETMEGSDLLLRLPKMSPLSPETVQTKWLSSSLGTLSPA